MKIRLGENTFGDVMFILIISVIKATILICAFALIVAFGLVL